MVAIRSELRSNSAVVSTKVFCKPNPVVQKQSTSRFSFFPRCRESQIPPYLDNLGVKYVGSLTSPTILTSLAPQFVQIGDHGSRYNNLGWVALMSELKIAEIRVGKRLLRMAGKCSPKIMSSLQPRLSATPLSAAARPLFLPITACRETNLVRSHKCRALVQALLCFDPS